VKRIVIIRSRLLPIKIPVSRALLQDANLANEEEGKKAPLPGVGRSIGKN